MNRYTRILLVVLTVALVISLFGVTFAQEKKIIYTGRQMGPSDIPTLDTAIAADVPSVQITTELFPELARLHEENVVIEPGMASWTKSEDGTVYTFNILPEVSWVRYNADTDTVEQVLDEAGNPRYVTAADFRYGMLRVMDPVIASDYSYVLVPWIQGADGFANSAPDASAEEREALMAEIGITAVDTYTLEVKVNNASVAFDYVLGMWLTSAQPSWAIEEYAEFWIEPENIQTYGPFALKEWVHEESLTMIKNPFWAGTEQIPAPKIDEVVFRFLDEEPQLAAFEAGELDVAEVPSSQIDRVLADANLSTGYASSFGTCTYYYGFNVRIEPFNDPRAVLAFSMAIDRQAIVDNITQAGEIPAGLFTLPILNAAPKQEDYPEIAVMSDAEAAKALWDEYLAETGKSASDFTLNILHNTSDLHASIAQAAQEMWNSTLGVNVTISSQDFGTYLDQREDADIYRAGWCFDYFDTNNFLYDTFHSSVSPDNGFNSPEFDALVEQAAIEADTAKRVELYAQAEQLLIRDQASIAPIYYYVTNDITAAGIERTYSKITREFYEKWDVTR